MGYVINDLHDLVEVSVASRAHRPHNQERRFTVVFNPSQLDKDLRAREFALFCHLALELRHVTVVVEELRFVTTPSYAPEAWSMLTMTGRDIDIHVIGTSQRPASIDKDFLGNCTTISSGRLEYLEDRIVTAKSLQIDPRELETLVDLEYWERTTGQVPKKGRISWK